MTFIDDALVSVLKSAEFDEFTDVDVASEEVDSIAFLMSLLHFVPLNNCPSSLILQQNDF